MRQYYRYLLPVGLVLVGYLLVRLVIARPVGLQQVSNSETGPVAEVGAVQLERGERSGQAAPSLPPSVPVASEEEAMRRDAEMYARMVGVNVDTAVARLGLQDEIGELNATLISQEGDIFGGLWVQHTPEYKIHIYVTGEEERIYRDHIQGTPLEPYTVIERRPATLRELRASEQEALTIVRALGVQATVSLSVQENRVEIHVEDKATFERLLRERNITLPRFTTVVQEGTAPSIDKP